MNPYKKGLYLEYFTVGYNLVEAGLSLLFGLMAGSIALVGFGLDSIIESLSGFVLIWRLRHHDKLDSDREEAIEEKAEKFVAITFFILGIYILYESIEKLLTRDIADPSPAGIIIAITSLVVMPILARQKLAASKAINSKALIADSKETLVCAWLSGALLLGLGLNYLAGFWQADPLVGIIIVGFLFKEGWEILVEDDD